MTLFEGIMAFLAAMALAKKDGNGGGTKAAPPGGPPPWPTPAPPWTTPPTPGPPGASPPPAAAPPPPGTPPALLPVRVYQVANGDEAYRVANRFTGLEQAKRPDGRWVWKELGDVTPAPNTIRVDTSGPLPNPWTPGQVITLPDSWTADKGPQSGARGAVSTAPRVSGVDGEGESFDTV